MSAWPQRVEHYETVNGQRVQTWRDSMHVSNVPKVQSSVRGPMADAPGQQASKASASGVAQRARQPRERTSEDGHIWQTRQNSLPFPTPGVRMKPHEIEFAEAFLAAGNKIERWLPDALPDPKTGLKAPRSDFEWVKDLHVELKRSNNLQTIKDHVKTGLAKGKDTFMIDFGDRPPRKSVLTGLAKFSPQAGKPTIWGFWDGHLVKLQ